MNATGNQIRWLPLPSRGNWISRERRFEITARYWGAATRPESYDLRDNVTGETDQYDTVREVKDCAERIIDGERIDATRRVLAGGAK